MSFFFKTPKLVNPKANDRLNNTDSPTKTSESSASKDDAKVKNYPHIQLDFF